LGFETQIKMKLFIQKKIIIYKGNFFTNKRTKV